MEKLGVFEHREQVARYCHVLRSHDFISHEGSLPDKMPDASLDLGFRAVELSLQFSQAFHLRSVRPVSRS